MLKVRALQSNWYGVISRLLTAATLSLSFLQEAFERAGEGVSLRGCDLSTGHVFTLGNSEQYLPVPNRCFEPCWKRDPLPVI